MIDDQSESVDPLDAAGRQLGWAHFWLDRIANDPVDAPRSYRRGAVDAFIQSALMTLGTDVAFEEQDNFIVAALSGRQITSITEPEFVELMLDHIALNRTPTTEPREER